MVKIAYLILAHNEPELLKKTIGIIDYNSVFYIHIDKKSNINKFKEIIKGDNIFFIDERYPIYWGGFNIVLATKKLMEEAINDANEYSHLVLISGQDFPIRDGEFIYKYFADNSQKEFIRAYEIEESNCKHCYYKIQKYRFMDDFFNNKLLSKVLRGVLRDIIFRAFKNKRYIREGNKKIFPCYGSQWWALTPGCARYVLKYGEENRNIDRYFKYAYAPDEMYFHTIIFNSIYATRTINGGIEPYSKYWSLNNFHFLINEDLNCLEFRKITMLESIRNQVKSDRVYKGTISFLKDYHFDSIVNSPYLFCRKVNEDQSASLIEKLQKYIETKKAYS